MNSKELAAALAEPFPENEVQWRAGPTSGDRKRAIALAYIDATSVMQRLDEVVGVGGWSTRFDWLDDGCVVCTLSVLIDGQWIDKADVGAPSRQPEAGDKRKAAFSGALKRAAVHFGIGRYLHRMPRPWVGYDDQKKMLTEKPKLPPWALPKPKSNPPPARQPAEAPTTNGNGPAPQAYGVSGTAFVKGCKETAQKWDKAGLCSETYFFAKLNEWSQSKGYGKPAEQWPADWITEAGLFLRELKKELEKPAPGAVLQTIDKLLFSELGWSNEQGTAFLRDRFQLEPSEVPTAHRAPSIIKALQEEVRKKLATPKEEEMAEAAF